MLQPDLACYIDVNDFDTMFWAVHASKEARST